MKTLLSTCCVLLLAVALATPALAEGGKRKGKGKRKGHRIAKLFKKFDTDKSGSLTAAEVPERVWTRISKADADGDGAVTKAELKEACKKRRKKKKGSRTDDSASS